MPRNKNGGGGGGGGGGGLIYRGVFIACDTRTLRSMFTRPT